MRRLGRLHLYIAIGLAVVVVLVGGLLAWRIERDPTAVATPTSVKAVTPPVSVSPSDGAVDVRLDAPVQISMARGRLVHVSITNPAGAATPAPVAALGPDPKAGPPELPGSGDLQHWQSSAPLEPATTYTVEVTATDAHGRQGIRRSTFTTLSPAKVLKVSIAPLDGQTVGVGMPIALYLSAPVRDRAAFESRLRVTTTPAVTGAWHWFSDAELHYRPEAYWSPHTKVSVNADIAAFDDGAGVWAVTPRAMSFNNAESHLSTVDAGTHQMTVTSGGAVVRTVDVSTGRDQYPTDSGIHVVSDKQAKVVMDSSTVGIPRNSPGGYYETVDWDVRISNSGEFVHAAPWSVADQGRNNVSHGCVNLSPADGQWFYNFSVPGDVVKVVGTPKQLAPTNGLGDWNVSWASWAN
jgi:lipoprotein-anchoring transpeptidase ErfK/SrfK